MATMHPAVLESYIEQALPKQYDLDLLFVFVDLRVGETQSVFQHPYYFVRKFWQDEANLQSNYEDPVAWLYWNIEFDGNQGLARYYLDTRILNKTDPEPRALDDLSILYLATCCIYSPDFAFFYGSSSHNDFLVDALHACQIHNPASSFETILQSSTPNDVFVFRPGLDVKIKT